MRRARRRFLALGVLALWWLPALGGVATALPALHGHGPHHDGVHHHGVHHHGGPAHQHATHVDEHPGAHETHAHGTHSHGSHAHGAEGAHDHGDPAEPERFDAEGPAPGASAGPLAADATDGGGEPPPRPEALELVQALIHGHSHGASEPDHEHPAPRAPVSVSVAPVLAPLAAVPVASVAGGCPPAVAAGHGPSHPPASPLFLSLCSFLL